jgi:hypothetical protein
MEDWGNIVLEEIQASDFWCLFNELIHDNSIFLHNKTTILQAYKDGNLFGLRVTESEQMYQRGGIMDSIFCSESFYLLPCFCIRENNKAIIIWTHTRARKMGFGKKLVKLLKIEYADKPLPDSIGFWKKCNIKF